MRGIESEEFLVEKKFWFSMSLTNTILLVQLMGNRILTSQSVIQTD